MSLDILLPVLAVCSALSGWVYLTYKKRKDPGQKVSTSFELSAALLLELAAAMLRAGQSLSGMTYELSQLSSAEAKDVLFEVSRGLSHGVSWQSAWQRAEQVNDCRTPPSLIPLRDCLESLADRGAPTADLLDIVAERHRRIEQRQTEKAAAKLSVKLVVPLGLCSLPAFICWGVIPVMIALLPGLMSNR